MGGAEVEEGGQKAQTSSSKIKSTRDVTYNMMTRANTVV